MHRVNMDTEEAYKILDESNYSLQITDFKERGIPYKTVGDMEREFKSDLIVMNNRQMRDKFGIDAKYLKGKMNTKNYGTRIEQFENLVRIRFPSHGKKNKDTLLKLKGRGLL
jgi:acyl CoA:acetate/3-ketoacid CoA transferase alpha subunit